MRALVIALLAFSGCSTDTTAGGRLICSDEGKTFEARVAPGSFSAVRERAEQAGLTDCQFEEGPPQIAHREAPRALPPPPPPPPPPPLDPAYDLPTPSALIRRMPSPPMNVPPTVLENNRVGGTKTVLPDVDTQLEIQRSGKDKIIGSFKFCISVSGEVTNVSQLKSTGFAAYDTKIMREIRDWKYLPYIYNGRETPVCTAVTFIWSVP